MRKFEKLLYKQAENTNQCDIKCFTFLIKVGKMETGFIPDLFGGNGTGNAKWVISKKDDLGPKRTEPIWDRSKLNWFNLTLQIDLTM